MKILVFSPFGGRKGHAQKFTENVMLALSERSAVGHCSLLTSDDFDSDRITSKGICVIKYRQPFAEKAKADSALSNIDYGFRRFFITAYSIYQGF